MNSLFKRIKISTQCGFTLIEVTLVLAIATAILFVSFQEKIRETERAQSRAAGQQIQILGKALNAYISLRSPQIQLGLTVPTGNGPADRGPRTCTPIPPAPGNTLSFQCSISLETIVSEGLLPTGYASATTLNSWGSPYTMNLAVGDASINFVVNGYIATATPWLMSNGTPNMPQLGMALQEIGFDGAITSGTTPTTMKGSSLNGAWSVLANEASVITAPGQLLYRAGAGSSLYRIFVPRDGSLPMTGNLQLGNHNISGVNTLLATDAQLTTASAHTIAAVNVNVSDTVTMHQAHITGVVVAGDPCPMSGLMQQDGTGVLLSCQGSPLKWDTIGGAQCVAGTQDFVSVGTTIFTIPAGCTSITAELIGGGGMGGTGGCNGGPGGGGGGGGYSRGTLSVSPGTSNSVVVGAGGQNSSFMGIIAGAGANGYGSGACCFPAPINGAGGTGTVGNGTPGTTNTTESFASGNGGGNGTLGSGSLGASYSISATSGARVASYPVSYIRGASPGSGYGNGGGGGALGLNCAGGSWVSSTAGANGSQGFVRLTW